MNIENRNFKIKSFVSNPNTIEPKEHLPVIGYTLQVDEANPLIGRSTPCRLTFGNLIETKFGFDKPFVVMDERTFKPVQCNYVAMLEFPNQKGEDLIDKISGDFEGMEIDITWRDLRDALNSMSESFLDRKVNKV